MTTTIKTEEMYEEYADNSAFRKSRYTPEAEEILNEAWATHINGNTPEAIKILERARDNIFAPALDETYASREKFENLAAERHLGRVKGMLAHLRMKTVNFRREFFNADFKSEFFCPTGDFFRRQQ